MSNISTIERLQAEEQKRRQEAQRVIHEEKVKHTKQELRDALKTDDNPRLAKACSSFFGLMQKPHLNKKSKTSSQPITQ